MIHRIFQVSVATMLLVQMLSVAAAQVSRSPTRVPVTVALVEKLQDYGEGPAVIMRRQNIAPSDVILLRANAANAQHLSTAIFELLAIRQRMGDQPTRTGPVRVRPSQANGGFRRRELPWAQRVIDDVRRAEVKHVPGVGNVRSVQIWLPRQQR